MATPAEHIAAIQALFLEVREKLGVDYAPVLDGRTGPHVAVAYEAVSVALALDDLGNGAQDLPRWRAFLDRYESLYASQIHVGLGWALGEFGSTDFEVVNAMEAQWRWRVYDGFGYYSGLFKRREAIRNQSIPDCIAAEHHAAFDQGLGRSFWYLSEGESGRLPQFLHLFPEARHPALWRGIGLASAYVGGLSESDFHSLEHIAGRYTKQLKCGALMAYAGLEKAKSSRNGDDWLVALANRCDSDVIKSFHERTADFGAVLIGVETCL